MIPTADSTRHPSGHATFIPGPPMAPRGGVTTWGQGDARLARAGLALRRLRYFRDLLFEGYEATRSADLPAGTLRSERLELGIGYPELDVVGLWTARREDGAVAIPFVEFLLAEFYASLEMFLSDLPYGVSAAELTALFTGIEAALTEATRGGEAAPGLPSLAEIYLPEAFLTRLCGTEGLLDRTLQRCVSLLVQAG
jgi:hypothetical protein